MSNFDLRDKFPDLEPVTSAPSQWTVNGCGFMLYGSRDYDRETNSSVQTYCLCIIFVPVMALRSYRVVKSGYNSYILGKVPLSGLAKIWNLLLFVSLLVGAGAWGWTKYQNSPDQVARRQLVKAQQQFAAGEYANGAALYQEVASGETQRAAQALTKLQQLLDAPETPEAGRLAVARVAVALAKQSRWTTDSGALAKSLRERATTLGTIDPVAGLALCELCESIETDRPAWQALNLDLLTRAVKQDPNNPELVSKLAVAYEADNKLVPKTPSSVPAIC